MNKVIKKYMRKKNQDQKTSYLQFIKNTNTVDLLKANTETSEISDQQSPVDISQSKRKEQLYVQEILIKKLQDEVQVKENLTDKLQNRLIELEKAMEYLKFQLEERNNQLQSLKKEMFLKSQPILRRRSFQVSIDQQSVDDYGLDTQKQYEMKNIIQTYQNLDKESIQLSKKLIDQLFCDLHLKIKRQQYQIAKQEVQLANMDDKQQELKDVLEKQERVSEEQKEQLEQLRDNEQKRKMELEEKDGEIQDLKRMVSIQKNMIESNQQHNDKVYKNSMYVIDTQQQNMLLKEKIQQQEQKVKELEYIAKEYEYLQKRVRIIKLFSIGQNSNEFCEIWLQNNYQNQKIVQIQFKDHVLSLSRSQIKGVELTNEDTMEILVQRYQSVQKYQFQDQQIDQKYALINEFMKGSIKCRTSHHRSKSFIGQIYQFFIN